MWPDPVSNPGPLTYESGALLTAEYDGRKLNGDIYQTKLKYKYIQLTPDISKS